MVTSTDGGILYSCLAQEKYVSRLLCTHRCLSIKVAGSGRLIFKFTKKFISISGVCVTNISLYFIQTMHSSNYCICLQRCQERGKKAILSCFSQLPKKVARLGQEKETVERAVVEDTV